MKNDNCIFCKLANGDIPTNSIYEDEDFNVILDASPATKGHALIIPKSHAANLYEIDDAVAAKVLPLAKKLITANKDKLGCDGFNIVQNNGIAAGQTVEHFHVHMIPRYNSDPDNARIMAWPHLTLSDDEFESIKNLMKN